MSFENDGAGVAGIDSFTVVAGEEIIEPKPTMRGAEEYWQNVLTELGLLRIRLNSQRLRDAAGAERRSKGIARAL